MTRPTPDAKSVFGRASEMPSPAARAAFLDDACAGHPAVRAEVETLLKALGRRRPVHALPGRPRRRDGALRRAGRRGGGDGRRPVHAPGADRRGRDGPGVRCRADAPGPPQGGAEGDQAGDGHPPGGRPVRGGAAGARAHGPPEHRQGVRRGGDRRRPPVLRHGAGEGRPDHRVRRRAPSHPEGPPRAVRAGVPGGPARAP